MWVMYAQKNVIFLSQKISISSMQMLSHMVMFSLYMAKQGLSQLEKMLDM